MNLKSSTFYEAILLLVLVCLLSLTLSKQGQKNVEDDGYKRRYHKLLELTEKGVKRLASLNDYQRFRESILKHILRVRVPGTLGHHEVKKFIIRRLQQLEWEVKIDEFDHDTPIGRRRFSNIVATLDPKAERRLVLAAHYDSKLILPDNGRYFVGATDSAVPCAMMLDLAETLHNKLKNRRKVRNVTLQLIFFDGEEAFVEWNEHDSIYGAKHLAEVMSHKPHSHKKGHSDSMTPTMLESMDALILLDLIGAKNPNFYDLYDNTSALYERLRSIEKRLAATKQLESYDAFSPYFVGKPRYPGLYIEDDHLPFLRKGVPIMHLIAIPFPDVWHKVTDNEDILDRATIENLLKIFRVFVAEYLHLE